MNDEKRSFIGTVFKTIHIGKGATVSEFIFDYYY